MRILMLLLLLFSGTLFITDVPAARADGAAVQGQLAAEDPVGSFDKQSYMIPMRDGVSLYTEVYIPKTIKEKLPILFWRTPYGLDHIGGGKSGGSVFAARLRELAEDGYIFVFQDIRGRHKSEGDFVMIRPSRDRQDKKAVDESTDAYDSIDWLVKNLPQDNGRVGMLGVSYPAWLAVMAAIDPHPALKAVSPQASPGDVYLTDDFFHNGAFRLAYGYEYVAFVELGDLKLDRYDTYDWYLKAGALSNIDETLKGKKTTWDDFAAHPAYDAYWKSRAVIPQLGKSKVASLTVGGWLDAEDGVGPIDIFRVWHKNDSDKRHYLVMGPWTHGGWLGKDRVTIGDMNFSKGTAKQFRETVLVPFFAYYLKGRGHFDQPRISLFQTGSNEWQAFDDWPAAGTEKRNLYFHEDGKLSFEPPQGTEGAADHYISDPMKPVPYRPRPIGHFLSGPGWSEWQSNDQRFVDGRPDVATWVSEPLEEALVLSGAISAQIYAATTGSDSDWIVKLIDVQPETTGEQARESGRQLLVSAEILRGRYRKGFDKAIPITPGAIEQYDFALPARDHKFLKGHRIMVQVQSTWFPMFDRNPQTFVPNIFDARAVDFKAATQTIYRSKRYPSHLVLDIVK